MSGQHSALGVVILSAIALTPYLFSLRGLPAASTDGVLYGVWAASFQQQLAEGVLYPRWMPELNRGLGSPTFFFYPPLAFWMSSAARYLSPIALSLEQSLGATIVIAGVLGATGTFQLARVLGASRWHAAILGLLYSQLPYNFAVNVLVRGAFGEIVACGLYPWLAFAAFRARTVAVRFDPVLACAIAAMMSAHPPTAMISIPISIAVAASWREGRHYRALLYSPVLGASLAAGYLATALTHHRHAPHESMFQMETLRHSLLLRTSVFHDTTVDFGRVELNALSLTNAFVFPALLLTAGGALLVCTGAGRKPSSHALHPWILGTLIVMLLLLCHPASWAVWEFAPLLHRLQFAWRLCSSISLVLVICLSLQMARWQVEHQPGTTRGAWLGMMVVALATFNVFFARHVYALPERAGAYDHARLDAPEHRLTGPVEAEIDQPVIFSDANVVLSATRIVGRTASTYVFTRDAGARVSLRQFPYTGWNVQVNGVEVGRARQAGGIVQAQVPPGKSRVEFLQAQTLEETIGLRLSAVATLVLFMLPLRGLAAHAMTRVRGRRRVRATEAL